MFTKLRVNSAFLHDLKREIVGRSASIEYPEEGHPVINFGTEFGIVVGALWRLKDSRHIIVTGDDHEQWFGLSEKVDAPAKANAHLADRKVKSIEFDTVTGDIRFSLTGKLTLEIITNSGGFESWVMWRGKEHFAVGANGGLV
jgi:hypothetical protein